MGKPHLEAHSPIPTPTGWEEHWEEGEGRAGAAAGGRRGQGGRLGTHLVEEQLSPLLLAQVHLLDSHQPARAPDGGNAHNTCGALANLDEVVQVGAGITRVYHQLQGCPELLMGHALGFSLW